MKKIIVSGAILELLPFVYQLLLKQISEMHILIWEVYGNFITGACYHVLLGITMCCIVAFTLKEDKRQVTIPVVFILCNLVMLCYFLRYNADLIMYLFMFIGYWSSILILNIKKKI